MDRTNRYADDWNNYSKAWDDTYGKHLAHLGDEWNGDDPDRETFIFNSFVAPYLNAGATVLEIGPGGGKWTVRIAERVKRLVCFDVAEEMLKRTRTRCDQAGFNNVEFVLGNGQDFQPLADSSFDFIFSYDVFVHLAPEDTFAYCHEMARVLAPWGLGVCHHALNSVAEGWVRFEQDSEYYRGGVHTQGQYYYYSGDGLRRMYEHCGIPLVRTYDWWCMFLCMFRKPGYDIVPRLEQLLWRLIGPGAAEPQNLEGIVKELAALPAALADKLAPILESLQGGPDVHKRRHAAAAIRCAWRGNSAGP